MSIDLDILRRGSGNDFFEELKNVPNNLNETTAQHFYHIATELLKRDNLSQLTNVEILKAIIRAISASQFNLETYIDLELCEKLPFQKFYLQEMILDLIFIIVSYAPRGMTKNVSKLFGHLIGRFPKKCLTILSIFGERFQIVLDPWPMIDLLFKYAHYFSTDYCATDYISLLVYLDSTFHDFREARQRHCWDAICNIFKKNENPAIIKYGYNALSHICELNPDIVSIFPFPENSLQHIQFQELQYSLISLLFRMPPNGMIEPMIKELFNLAKSENSDLCQCQQEAGMALAILANDRLCCQTIARDITWLNYDLPTKSNTIKLLAQVIKYNPCRRFLSSNLKVVAFLNRILNESQNDDFLLSSAGFLANRLLISNQSHYILSKEQFISNYFDRVINDPNPSVTVAYATVALSESIAKLSDFDEINRDICNFISDAVQFTDEKLNQVASKTATQLATIPRCARVFKDDRLDEYFSNHSENDFAMEFLNNYNEAIFQNMADRFPPGQGRKRQFRQGPAKQLSTTIKTRNINLDLVNNESSDSEKDFVKKNEEESQKSISESDHDNATQSESEEKIPPKSKSNSDSEKRISSSSSSESEQKVKPKSKSDSESEKRITSSSESESEPKAQPKSKSDSDSEKRISSSSESESEQKAQPKSEIKNVQSYSDSESQNAVQPKPEPEKNALSNQESDHETKSNSEPEKVQGSNDINNPNTEKTISDHESDSESERKSDSHEQENEQNEEEDEKLDLLQQTDEKECKSEPGNQSEPETTPRPKPRTSSYRFFNGSAPHSPLFIPTKLPPPNIDSPALLPTGSLLKSHV